jgi:hypothetical protein
MKKNLLIKGILVLLVIALLIIGFTGCGTVTPTWGTVYITILGTYSNLPYEVYIDDSLLGTTNPGEWFGIDYVSPGIHNIFVGDTVYYLYSDEVTQDIPAGETYINLYPNASVIII